MAKREEKPWKPTTEDVSLFERGFWEDASDDDTGEVKTILSKSTRPGGYYVYIEVYSGQAPESPDLFEWGVIVQKYGAGRKTCGSRRPQKTMELAKKAAIHQMKRLFREYDCSVWMNYPVKKPSKT